MQSINSTSLFHAFIGSLLILVYLLCFFFLLDPAIIQTFVVSSKTSLLVLLFSKSIGQDIFFWISRKYIRLSEVKNINLLPRRTCVSRDGEKQAETQALTSQSVSRNGQAVTEAITGTAEPRGCIPRRIPIVVLKCHFSISLAIFFYFNPGPKNPNNSFEIVHYYFSVTLHEGKFKPIQVISFFLVSADVKWRLFLRFAKQLWHHLL